ncbi:MAG: hypothetical protein P1V97_07725 [Planctomycetota bacterium]|nr:hypothetical protein [Planctomycetota bacterium]
MDLFIRHTELCFAIAAFFLAFAGISLLYKRIRSLPMLVPGFFWLAYGAWEYSLKGSGANIRVDLLLIYPLLLLAMVVGAGMTMFFTMKKPSGLMNEEAKEAEEDAVSDEKDVSPAE